MSTITKTGLYLLASDDLVALLDVSADIRLATRGQFSRANIGNEIARAGGLHPHASIRALVGMHDLRLPTPKTLDGLAVGAGIPERSAAWIERIEQLRAARR